MSFSINIPEHILYEDEYILIINKPAGLMVEPDRNNHPNLLQQVKKYLKEKNDSGDIYAQHINRLDRPVSGIVLFAKQKSVLRNLSEQFAQRKVTKKYIALTDRSPVMMEGIITTWIRKEKKKAVIYEEEILYSEKASLNYIVKKSQENIFIWDINLHTGKYHQIRAQLAFLNCPILGDTLYGSSCFYKENCIALHAKELVFEHPVSGHQLKLNTGYQFKD